MALDRDVLERWADEGESNYYEYDAPIHSTRLSPSDTLVYNIHIYSWNEMTILAGVGLIHC